MVEGYLTVVDALLTQSIGLPAGTNESKIAFLQSDLVMVHRMAVIKMVYRTTTSKDLGAGE